MLYIYELFQYYLYGFKHIKYHFDLFHVDFWILFSSSNYDNKNVFMEMIFKIKTTNIFRIRDDVIWVVTIFKSYEMILYKHKYDDDF